MNDAQTLFREGVLALKERHDVAEGRRLLTESLRLNPQNEMAWLWLARAVHDPAKRLQCIERALKIDPSNQQALALRHKYNGDGAQVAAVTASAITEAPPAGRSQKPAQGNALTPQEQQHIRQLFRKADQLVEQGEVEDAIEQWVRVLEIEVDNELALRHAVGYLSRLKYIDDARELVWRALEAGTQHPSVYLTAIDIARYQQNYDEEDLLCEKLALLPTVDDSVIADVVDKLIKTERFSRAEEITLRALETHPRSQKLLKRMGDICQDGGREAEATHYYDRAARLGTRTREGREADQKLNERAVLLTDSERGSVTLAWREAAGFGVVYLLLAWQDAGMNLLNIGPGRLIGVIVAVVGGYLLVTATSSPQQQPLAKLLGGTVPDKSGRAGKQTKPVYEETTAVGMVEEPTHIPMIPPALRVVIGLMGVAVLGVALWLTFGEAITLLLNPLTPPDLPHISDYLMD